MKRFKALDVFRGMTVCFMIIVNTPGNYSTTFSMLLHAKWHGFTPTDLVFPSFLFAVGNALAFVMPKWSNWSDQQVFKKLLIRSLIIFLLGYLMYWFPFVRWTDAGLSLIPFSDTRIFGVLQRIALCYLIGGIMIYYMSPKTLIWASSAILLLYWAVMSLFGDYGDQNAALKLDLWLLGPGHLYRGYGYPFDPEGLLSTFPAVVNVIAGYLTGRYVRDGVDFEKLAKVLLSGLAMMFVAYLWDVTFPINKSLWTSSFVLLTTGLDCVIIAAIIYVIEMSGRKVSFGFFDPFGKNPLFVYLFAGYLATTLHFLHAGDRSLFGIIYQEGFGWMSPYLGSLMFALTFTFVCWLLAKWLDIKKIYIRV